jgi:alpha-mannosidase
VRVESRYGNSTLVEEYLLGAGARYVDVRVVLDWHEQLKLLKLRYPTSIETPTATYETPYGFIERPANGDEEPGQAWLDVSGEAAGLAVLNDAKHGFDVRGGDIGISAVRSPVWAWHEPRELDPDATYEYMDQGRQEFTVRLVPHNGDWRAADVPRLAAGLNQPVYALLESYHPGSLPQRASHISVDAPNVVVTVVKRGEDGDGSVVRAYETAGTSAHASFELLGRSWSAEFRAHELKTFRVPSGSEQPVTETNLLEL